MASKNESDVQEYEVVEADGSTRTYRLTEEDAKRVGAKLRTSSKAAPAPSNKQQSAPKNKGA